MSCARVCCVFYKTTYQARISFCVSSTFGLSWLILLYMPTFKYRVRTTEGLIQAGLVDAPTQTDAVDALVERGYEVLILEKYTTSQVKKTFSFINRIKTKDIVVISRTLSVMISASVPLVDALKNIATQTENLALREIMHDVASEVETGSRLSDAFERH